MSFIQTAVQSQAPATYDFYALIHKGLRLALSDLLVRIGRADPRDGESITQLIADVRRQCHLSARHLAHEDSEIHTALEERCPGAAARLDHDHAEHRAAIAELLGLLDRIEAADAERPALWRGLYLRLSRFVADDFTHMAQEELVVLPVLQNLFTDEELHAMEMRILARIEPDDMMAFLARMVSAGSHAERVTLLKGVKAMAPAEAYDAIVRFAVKPQMSAEDWQVLDWSIDQA